MHPRTPPSKALIVAAATPMEMRAAFPDCEAIVPGEGGHGFLEFCRRRLILLVTGIGPINAGMALGRLLGTGVGPLGVLNLGVAGSFDLEELPLCRPVLVQEEIWPEYGLAGEDGIDPKGIGLAMGMLQGRPVWDRLALSPQDHARRLGLCLPDCPQTISLTVAGVSGSARRAAMLRRRYTAGIENMEGFALAWTCAVEDVPFVEVRTVSNLAGSRRGSDWDLRGALRVLGEVAAFMLRIERGQS